MEKDCHGCGGRGWVDSQYKGAVLCPVCLGRGKIDATQAKTPAIPLIITIEPSNKNALLFELDKWLMQQKGIRFDHPNKTMNTYHFTSKIGRERGLVWVSNYGAGRIYLFRGRYDAIDPDNRVKYVEVWGGYPQFEIRALADVEYAKKLILYALENF